MYFVRPRDRVSDVVHGSLLVPMPSALERMLLINPNLPRVRLELGVLYFRLGSYQLAKTYLDRAVEGENVPDEVRQRVETFLAEIEKRLSRHQFSGSVFGGVRYQTNANAGPTSGTVLANGVTATLADQFTRTSDENLFVSANVRHTYDLQLQAGEVWETNLTVYGSEQTQQNQLDLIFFNVESGPRGPFAPAWLEAATRKGQHHLFGRSHADRYSCISRRAVQFVDGLASPGPVVELPRFELEIGVKQKPGC